MKLISPISSLEGSMEEKTYDTPVIIKSKMAVMTDVLFPHDVHAYWLSCKTCHPGIFVQTKGGNIDMTMWDILDGKSIAADVTTGWPSPYGNVTGAIWIVMLRES